jgi:hypothetical protein
MPYTADSSLNRSTETLPPQRSYSCYRCSLERVARSLRDVSKREPSLPTSPPQDSTYLWGKTLPCLLLSYGSDRQRRARSTGTCDNNSIRRVRRSWHEHLLASASGEVIRRKFPTPLIDSWSAHNLARASYGSGSSAVRVRPSSSGLPNWPHSTPPHLQEHAPRSILCSCFASRQSLGGVP